MNPLLGYLAKKSGRSWWQVKYYGGKVISEWEGIDWTDISKNGIVALRLLCPNGMAGELQADDGFFQLKSGFVEAGKQSQCEAHIIGVVTSINGECTCRAWDYRIKKLTEFKDNVTDMKYLNIGRLNMVVQGMKV